MQESESNNSTCLLCCEQRQIFILPNCNHKHVCWRCCINMIKQGKFQCPFCKNSVQQRQMIIFVTEQQMMAYSFEDILKSPHIELLKSQKNSNYYYSNEQVAQKIEYETNYNCPFEECDDIFDSLNQLKKHLDVKHKKQYCDICLTHRKCIQSEQILYSENQYQRHIKSGEFSQNGDLVLYHPTCDFCRQHFYDIDQFKRHLEFCHQKCHICVKSSDELKYIYYKDYEQAVQHFKKSHFYCEIGTCMGTKFQNVFVTEQSMNQHIQRIHKKSKKGNQPILNIELGFNKFQKQQAYEWDKVGKNFLPIFQMVEKHFTSQNLQPVQHEDVCIDIRDFYIQQSRKTLNLSLTKIKQKIEDRRYELNYKEKELYIDDVDFFRPLEMQPVSKVQLERFIHLLFDHKTASQIVNQFFTGRQNFKTMDAYFAFVRDKMKQSSNVTYFYAFPQLIRFFKNQNPHKAAMDEFYYESLRSLKVKKLFIIHSKSKYSEVLFFMKNLIEKQMNERDQDSSKTTKKQLDIQKYLNFLKDMNSSFYVQNQQQIFYVSKQKITNLYHMINKCRVQDFLKMNWLLKIGFNNQAYKIIYKELYYKEETESENAMKKLTIQELAYLYSYCTICLGSIFQKTQFKKNKEKPLPLFLSEILSKMKKSSTHQKMRQIIQAQNKSLRLDVAVRQNKNKGIIINKQQHPSLLDRNIEVPGKTKPPDRKDQFPVLASFGTIRPKVWNQSLTATTKRREKIATEDYPSILSNSGTNKKLHKSEEIQDFPVFHYVGKKNKKAKGLNQTVNLKSGYSNVVGWGNSNFVPNKWNQQTTKNQWEKRQQDQRQRKQRHQQIQQELSPDNEFKKQIQAINQKTRQVQNILGYKSTKSKIQQKPIKKQEVQKQPQPMVIMQSKKNKKIDEQQETIKQTNKKNKKNKNNQKQQQSKQVTSPIKTKDKHKFQKQQQWGLFEIIQKESQIISKKSKNEQKKLRQFLEQAEGGKKQQKQKIPSKSQVYSQNTNQFFEKDDFPELQKKIKQKPGIQKPSNNEQKKQVKKDEVKPKSKKTKIRFDDTSSQQQTKAVHKKSDDFVSITDKFGKNAEEKVSKVNQIIQAAKAQEKAQNQIKVKKGKNGKKVIVQRVNFYDL